MTLTFLVLLGAPHIYDISRLRVNEWMNEWMNEIHYCFAGCPDLNICGLVPCIAAFFTMQMCFHVHKNDDSVCQHVQSVMRATVPAAVAIFSVFRSLAHLVYVTKWGVNPHSNYWTSYCVNRFGWMAAYVRRHKSGLVVGTKNIFAFRKVSPCSLVHLCVLFSNFFSPLRNSPQWSKASSLSRIHDHTQTHHRL
jgi:hypothetical protein